MEKIIDFVLFYVTVLLCVCVCVCVCMRVYVRVCRSSSFSCHVISNSNSDRNEINADFLYGFGYCQKKVFYFITRVWNLDRIDSN